MIPANTAANFCARSRAAAMIIFAAVIFATTATAKHDDRIDPLPPEQAFVFSAAKNGRVVNINFQLAEDIYLYKHRLLVTVDGGGVSLAEINYPRGVIQRDEFFGEQEVFFNEVNVQSTVVGDGDFTLIVFSQGCDDGLKICYPPRRDAAFFNADSDEQLSENRFTDISSDIVSTANGADAAGDAATLIASQNFLWTALAFFGFGLLLSLTPCVLPLLPILLGVIGGGKNRRQIILRTVAYIGGVTATFTVFGVVAGLSGQLLAATLQQPPALIFMSSVFVLLALSMFGLFNFQLPVFLQNANDGGGIGGALMLGGLSAITVSPCVAAPLAGALIYIGKSGDAVGGALALFSLALGMCLPLLAAGVGAGKVLPRAGAWVINIKCLFGVLLLAAAVWVSSVLLPVTAQMILYGALLLAAGVIINGIKNIAIPLAAFCKTAAILLILWGAVLFVGGISGGRDVLSPLSHLSAAGGGNSVNNQPPLQFEKINSLSELQTVVNNDAPIMLEFYADWCVSCKEFERYTLSDTRVQKKLRPIRLLRADVGDNNDEHKKLLRAFNLFGPPAILFFNNGKLIKNARVIGYQSADAFLKTLNAAGI